MQKKILIFLLLGVFIIVVACSYIESRNISGGSTGQVLNEELSAIVGEPYSKI